MKIIRRKSKIIKIGSLSIGGNYPVTIQSMTKTKTADIDKTIRQIKELENTGCEIVRLAIKDSADAKALKEIKPNLSIPMVADIHFNWRLAIEAIDNGADKIRLNPGNIYEKSEIREIISALKQAKIPLRIGVNSGSVKIGNRCKVLGVRGDPIPNTYNLRPNISDFMVQSVLNYIKMIEGFGFYDIVISLKASNVLDTVEAYQKMARLCSYPLHLGVTATGLPYSGIIKSSVAIGSLLLQGIGDTIRISLTDKAQQEVRVARSILEALKLRCFGPEIISCPTCGRCEVDLVKIVKDLEERLQAASCKLQANNLAKIAVMGCVVNGPGEAKESDIGIAFGKKEGLLFRKGKSIKKVSLDRCVDVLLEEVCKFVSV